MNETSKLGPTPSLPDFTVGRQFVFQGRTVEVATPVTFSDGAYRLCVIDGPGPYRGVLATSLTFIDEQVSHD